MVSPRLIHPVRVILEQIDKSATAFNENAREPIRAVKRKRLELYAQIKWDTMDEPEARRAGMGLNNSGYFLVQLEDTVEKGIDINRGDKVVQIGSMVFEDLFVTGFQPMGHYQQGATLLKVVFKSRAEQRGSD